MLMLMGMIRLLVAVLTKVFVYSGIGIVAVGVVPVMFEILGWGVKTS